MRTLIGPTGSSMDLSAAYPWPVGRAWTRVTMMRALDGGVAGADNRSGSISSEADREVLSASRRLADAVVIGASTMRLERYGPLRVREDAADERRALGLRPAPVLAIVSGSLDLPWDEKAFTESAVTPIVVTTGSAPAEALEDARRRVDVVVLPGERPTATAIVAALRDRGLTRIVCEGGPGLLRSFAEEDVVDEVAMTVSPHLVTYGPGAGGAGDDAPLPHAFELVGLIENESFLFARYIRTGRRDESLSATTEGTPA
ncbi:MAG: dihydrofolate reductase family protein [Nocardioidaceae bacterium]|nr:dihydrofolate reductase family protein [Nocardioidaceae bacterium]